MDPVAEAVGAVAATLVLDTRTAAEVEDDAARVKAGGEASVDGGGVLAGTGAVRHPRVSAAEAAAALGSAAAAVTAAEALASRQLAMAREVVAGAAMSASDASSDAMLDERRRVHHGETSPL